jgi:hypothetical protein
MRLALWWYIAICLAIPPVILLWGGPTIGMSTFVPIAYQLPPVLLVGAVRVARR